MSNDALSAEFVAALHKELKEQRAKRATIDDRIARIEALLGPSVTVERAPTKKVKPPPDLVDLATGDACVWLLKPRGNGARMTSREIADGLAAHGYKRKTDQITAALHHRQDKKGDINRAGSYWVYVAEVQAPKPATPAATIVPAAVATPAQQASKAPESAPPANPQKGTPSSANGGAASALR